jgi:TolA-binding protein
MATLKRVDKRLNEVEQWIKEFEKGAGPTQTMDNMNFLVSQTRQLGERLQGADGHINELRGALEQNQQILQQFLEKEDMVKDWQFFIKENYSPEEENNNAVQEQSAETLDVQEQAGDGEAMGEGDSEE